MRVPVSVLRLGALLLAAAYAVHQLRYELAFGTRAGEVLAHHGHGYLSVVAPLVGVLLGFAVAQWLVRVASAIRPVHSPGMTFAALWVLATAALLCLYGLQELAEGALATGHPGGWSGVFGAGGWLAVPLAAALGVGVAASSYVAGRVERAPVRVIGTPRVTPGDPPLLYLATPEGVPRSRGIPKHSAGRGPPLFSVWPIDRKRRRAPLAGSTEPSTTESSMPRNQRLGLLALAILVLVVALVALRPSDDNDTKPERAATATPTATTDQGASAGEEATADATPEATPDPGPLLRAGNVERIEVNKGDQVRFRARSDTPEEIHVHGYDITKELEPGQTAQVSFKATIEGIFEIELEDAGEEVAELRVEP